MNYLIFIYFIDRETDIQRGEVICPGSHSQGLRDPKACVLVLSSGVCLVPDPRGAPNVWQDKSAPQRVQCNAHSRAHRLTQTHTPPPALAVLCSESPNLVSSPSPEAARLVKRILIQHRLSSPSMEPGVPGHLQPQGTTFPESWQ